MFCIRLNRCILLARNKTKTRIKGPRSLEYSSRFVYPCEYFEIRTCITFSLVTFNPSQAPPTHPSHPLITFQATYHYGCARGSVITPLDACLLTFEILKHHSRKTDQFGSNLP